MSDVALRVENLPKLSHIGSRERDKSVRDTLRHLSGSDEKERD